MQVPVKPVGYDKTIASYFGTRSLAGLGCGCQIEDDGGVCSDPEPCPSGADQAYLALVQAGLTHGASDTNTSPVYPSSVPGSYVNTGMSTQQLQLLNTLAQGGLTLGKELAAQPGQTISPTGQITYQNPGYPVGTNTLGVGVGSMGSSTVMLLGVGLLAVLFMSQRKN